MSFLSDLEYYVYDEFKTFLSYPLTMFQFVRYIKGVENVIELKTKVFGIAHGRVLISASTSLGDIYCHFNLDNSSKNRMKSQLFFAVCSALKRDYFDKFLAIHSYLDQFKYIDL